MSVFAQGDERKYGGRFENKVPTKDILEVLYLLLPSSDSREPRYIDTNEHPPELYSRWYIEGDSGGDSSGTDFYLIDLKLVEELKKKGFVEPMREPVIGRTIVHNNRLVLTPLGKAEWKSGMDKETALAWSLRRRRAGDYELLGHRREHLHFGPLSFEFRNKRTGKRSRVYPSSGKIERVK